jgi:hypothetical protein
MSREKSEETFTAEETARRADAALRIALRTPPKPHIDSTVRKSKSRKRKSLKRRQTSSAKG